MASGIQERFLARVLSADAAAVAIAEPNGCLDDFAGHKYCVAVTYRRTGVPVPTPVWFGTAGGRLYFRTEAESGKVKRIRANGRIRVAPCTSRGKPLGRTLEGTAQILPPEREHEAEAAIVSNYGMGRRIYSAYARRTRTSLHYVEVTPTRPDSA
ncbi:MAG TPA: PPOX class F420-dependent oxidoreductase [Thermoleophilaceae bacterium]|jgi:hypothetical protein